MVIESSGLDAPVVSPGLRIEEPAIARHIEARRTSVARERAIVSTIIILATLLCGYWALRFPLLLEPDEVAHADAAFAYFDAGRPFVVHRPTITNFVTPQIRYLMKVTDYRRMRYNNHAAVRDGYGTRAYLRALDAAAPQPSNEEPSAGARVPYVLAVYPSTYYYAVATAMRAGWTAFGQSLSAAIFAGRFLNVVMLASTLALGYAVLLEMSFTSVQRMMLLAGIAFFPLSTWMGAYIQPDNQSALLMTATLLAALALRKRPASLARLVLYAAAASALGLTKVQYALVAIVAFGLAFRGSFERESLAIRFRGLVGGVAIPIIVTISGRYLSPIGGLNAITSGPAYAQAGLSERLRIASYDALTSATSTLLGGQTFAGFWLHFGLRSGGIFTSAATRAVTIVLVALTALTLAAWCVSQRNLLQRLQSVATRYGARRAWRFFGSDPALNAYALLTTLLLIVSSFTNGGVTLQGRYWYPVLLPIVLLSVRSIGGAVPRATRGIATSIACAFWMCYSAIAAPCAVVAMNRTFYHRSDTVPTWELGQIESIEVNGRVRDREGLTVAPGSIVTVRGGAIDSAVGLPARDIRFRIDRGLARRAVTGLPDRQLPMIFNDQVLARSGFLFHVPTRGLTPGSHEIAIAAFEERAPEGLPIETLRFSIAGKVGP